MQKWCQNTDTLFIFDFLCYSARAVSSSIFTVAINKKNDYTEDGKPVVVHICT